MPALKLDQMTSASLRPSTDPYDDFVAKVAELRERIAVLEDEKMRMAPAQSVAMEGLRRAALSFKEKTTLTQNTRQHSN